MLDKAFTLHADNIDTLLLRTRNSIENQQLGEWFIFQQYGICPRPFISDFAFEAWRLYCTLDGTKRIATPTEYAALPALYVATCEVLDDEVHKATKIREKLDESKSKRKTR